MSDLNAQLSEMAAHLMRADVPLMTVREYMVRLTAMWGTFRQRHTTADVAYKQRLDKCRRSEPSATAAKIAAEASPEYAAMRFAKDDEDYAYELYLSCKAALKSVGDETRL